jgi:hypothetical protein
MDPTDPCTSCLSACYCAPGTRARRSPGTHCDRTPALALAPARAALDAVPHVLHRRLRARAALQVRVRVRKVRRVGRGRGCCRRCGRVRGLLRQSGALQRVAQRSALRARASLLTPPANGTIRTAELVGHILVHLARVLRVWRRRRALLRTEHYGPAEQVRTSGPTNRPQL